MDKRMDAEYQRKVDSFVNQNVYYCVSSLIYNLNNEVEPDSEHWEQLVSLSENYDETEDEYYEIFEHWLVSDWLARKLGEKGETVDFDFMGLTIWGRSTTGQSISIDNVICDIYDEMISFMESY